MPLPLLTDTQLLAQFAGAAQAAVTKVLDFTVGSVWRAIGQASNSIALWMQWLIVLLLRQTRLATSVGPDVDSWVADFGGTIATGTSLTPAFARLPAVAATGKVTFSRYSGTTAVIIPVGTNVKTADGTQTFSVVADTKNPGYSAVYGGYLLLAGGTVNATVQAATPGSAGNVAAGTLTVIASAVQADTVTNAFAFGNGADAESDAACKARFQLYFNSRYAGTATAIANATAGVQQGLTYSVLENTNAAGVATPGTTTVIVDDGSGNPPASLITAVSAAVQAVRPLGSTVNVLAVVDLTATVALTITTNPAANKPNLLAPVQAAITAYIQALPVSGALSYTRLAVVAFGVDPSIIDVTGLLLNSGTADIVPTAFQRVVPSTVTVS